MKNKKGFTLVELLGVIVILSMIVLVTAPALLNTLTNSEEKRINEFEKTVFLAAETYFQKNSELYPQLAVSNGKAFVQLSTLVEEGYLKDTLIDPRTDEKIDTTTSIEAKTSSDGTYTYSFQSLNLSYQGYTQTGLVLLYDGVQKMMGNKLDDLSPRGYDGVFQGLDSTSGWQGNHIHFDGKDDFVKQIVPVSGDFTIEIVVGNSVGVLNTEKYGSVFTINDWVSDGVYPSIMLFYDGRTNKNLAFRALVPKDGDTAYKEITLGNTFVTALKTKNTFTFVKQGKSLKVYFNNTLIGSSTDAAFMNRFDMSTMNLNIGSWENYYTYFDLYSMRIYNKALSEEERVNNYQLDMNRF